MASKYEAFDGQVIFHCTYETMEAFIVREAIDAAIPEHEDFEDKPQLAAIWANFRLYLSNTQHIEFNLLKNADDDLKELKAFWKLAENNTDYPALWVAFRQQITRDVQDNWRDGLSHAIPARLLAPPELQPNAPEDEALDPNALRPETVT